MLAGRRRALHHAAAGVFAKSRHRQAQLRHVPHAGLRRAHRRACTGRRTSRARSTIAACSSTGGKRMDVAVAIGADPATMYSAILPLPPDLDEMMIAGFLRQSPVEMVKCQTCDLEVPAQRRDRAGRLRGTGRTAHRGAVRRSYRLLFAGRRVSGIPRHLRDAAQGADLRDDHRGSAAHGGLLHGQGDRAHFSAADAPAIARSARYRHAARGRVPQPDSGVDPQVVSGPRAQGDALHLGHGAGDVFQSASWWWTKTWTCRTTARWRGRR